MENDNVQPLRPLILKHDGHYMSRGLGIVGPMTEKFVGPSTGKDDGILFACRRAGFNRVTWRPNGMAHGSDGSSYYDLLHEYTKPLPESVSLVNGEPFDVVVEGERYIDHSGFVHGPMVSVMLERLELFMSQATPGLLWKRDGRVNRLTEHHPRNLKKRYVAAEDVLVRDATHDLKIKHDERVAELLAAYNAEVGRRRAAEQHLDRIKAAIEGVKP
jgi:hypothetical protein